DRCVLGAGALDVENSFNRQYLRKEIDCPTEIRHRSPHRINRSNRPVHWEGASDNVRAARCIEGDPSGFWKAEKYNVQEQKQTSRSPEVRRGKKKRNKRFSPGRCSMKSWFQDYLPSTSPPLL